MTLFIASAALLLAILGWAAWVRYRRFAFFWFADWLVERAKKTPYYHLHNKDGSPYMERFWLVPYTEAGSQVSTGTGKVSAWRRPIARLLQTFDIAIRIHRIQSSDDDRAYHDHPWPWARWILFGGYWELRPIFKDGIYQGAERRWHGPGSWAFRHAEDFHILELESVDVGTERVYLEAWTLFISFRKRQSWGFMPEPARNKVYYREYLGLNEP